VDVVDGLAPVTEVVLQPQYEALLHVSIVDGHKVGGKGEVSRMKRGTVNGGGWQSDLIEVHVVPQGGCGGS
jgi:hypothetical protein